MRAWRDLVFALLLAGPAACSPAAPAAEPSATGPAKSSHHAPTPAPPAPREVVLTIVGTNDLHGHVERLPELGGYLARLRELRRDDGGVVLVDAGDMFQGTLEANLTEGAAVIAAYNALGYSAVALGNHDFDYGPTGDVEPLSGADPQGAVKERLGESRFAALSANLIERATGQVPRWRNLSRSTLVQVAGVEVGLVGVLTRETPAIVMKAYFAGLDVTPLAPAISAEAAELRARGARVVVAVAHAGGECQRFDRPEDLGSCEADDEIMQVARALPKGAVDVIVGGHTHKGMAHLIEGTAVVEAHSYGRAFSRVDVHVPAAPAAALRVRLFPPRDLCPSDPGSSRCGPVEYEGAPVVADAVVARATAAARELAERRRDERLGVRVEQDVRRAQKEESALGNLFADLLLEAVPEAEAALLNGGGLRASLPAGALTYGQLYQAMPFDNRVALIAMSGAQLRAVIRTHLGHDRHGILLVGGLRVEARCTRGALDVGLVRKNGKPVRDGDAITVVTSDYLATGGDDLYAPAQLGAGAVSPRTEIMRDVFAARLRARGGTLSGDSPTLYDPKRPRLSLPSARPVLCGK